VESVKTDSARAAQGQAKVRFPEAQSDSKALNVHAQTEYERKCVETETEAKREVAAQAKAAALRIEAEAGHCEIVVYSQARKRTMVLESEATRLLNATPRRCRCMRPRTAMFRQQHTLINTWKRCLWRRYSNSICFRMEVSFGSM
jgi:hypothetical protein